MKVVAYPTSPKGLPNTLAPIRLQKEEKVLPDSVKEGPTRTVDEQQKESPMTSIQKPPRPSSESPPSSPQKRQILPQSTMSLLKSQVTELQVDNAKIDQAKSTLMQSTTIKEHNPQANFDSRSHEAKKDRAEETRKEETPTCNKELMADQGMDAITKNIIAASCSQPQAGVVTNIPRKPTPSTWVKFEVIGKSGVKIPCMALVDFEKEKSFMSSRGGHS